MQHTNHRAGAETRVTTPAAVPACVCHSARVQVDVTLPVSRSETPEHLSGVHSRPYLLLMPQPLQIHFHRPFFFSKDCWKCQNSQLYHKRLLEAEATMPRQSKAWGKEGT